MQSEQMRFAVTPWFHVYVSKKEFNRISVDDIEVLATALAAELTKAKKNQHKRE
ncbi:MAG: hypothetical protein ACJ0BI_01415 [Paracoccaceae bacterium]